MKTNTKYFFSLFIVILTTSCGNARVSERDAGANKDSTLFVLNYSDVMEFTRGINSSFNITGNFSGETNSPISIDGLPESANYDDGVLTWLPPCDLKPENGQFIRGYMVRRIRITMESKLSDSIVQRPAILIVHKDGDGSVCNN